MPLFPNQAVTGLDYAYDRGADLDRVRGAIAQAGLVPVAYKTDESGPDRPAYFAYEITAALHQAA